MEETKNAPASAPEASPAPPTQPAQKQTRWPLDSRIRAFMDRNGVSGNTLDQLETMEHDIEKILVALATQGVEAVERGVAEHFKG